MQVNLQHLYYSDNNLKTIKKRKRKLFFYSINAFVTPKLEFPNLTRVINCHQLIENTW